MGRDKRKGLTNKLMYKIKNQEKEKEAERVGMWEIRIRGEFDKTFWEMMKCEECGVLQSRKGDKREKRRRKCCHD